jgi:phytoene desaturase
VLGVLERRVMPGVRSSVVTSHMMTPDDFEHTLRSADGSAFGPEPLLTQSAWFRYHNRAPDIDGLYFVGAGTHPGAGVPGVLNSAKLLDRIVPSPSHAQHDLSERLVAREPLVRFADLAQLENAIDGRA